MGVSGAGFAPVFSSQDTGNFDEMASKFTVPEKEKMKPANMPLHTSSSSSPDQMHWLGQEGASVRAWPHKSASSGPKVWDADEDEEGESWDRMSEVKRKRDEETETDAWTTKRSKE